jgi:fumarylacetoacetate (FAA) hydrolase family protein
VYAADRPELFFKSVAWRVVTDGELIAGRPDSALTVPELDFTLLDGDVVEVTVEHVGTLTNPVGTLAAARAASALRVPPRAAG